MGKQQLYTIRFKRSSHISPATHSLKRRKQRVLHKAMGTTLPGWRFTRVFVCPAGKLNSVMTLIHARVEE